MQPWLPDIIIRTARDKQRLCAVVVGISQIIIMPFSFSESKHRQASQKHKFEDKRSTLFIISTLGNTKKQCAHFRQTDFYFFWQENGDNVTDFM